MDQSKKTMRHFYCRDVLWETFEQMANDFDCSIDYLINESMRAYAKTKNYPGALGSTSFDQGGDTNQKIISIYKYDSTDPAKANDEPWVAQQNYGGTS